MTADNRSPPQQPLEDWLQFKRTGVHAFAGLTVAGGFLSGGYTASEGSLWGNGVDGAFLLALRGGVVIGQHEIALEIAPYTYFWDLYVGKGPEFEVNASYAYYVPLLTRPRASISWPLRAGVGFVAGGNDTSGGNVFFQSAPTSLASPSALGTSRSSSTRRRFATRSRTDTYTESPWKA